MFRPIKNLVIRNTHSDASHMTPCAFKMAHELDSSNLFEFCSFIRGYHVYQTIWEPKLNEELLSKLELCNEYDKNVVCVIKR